MLLRRDDLRKYATENADPGGDSRIPAAGVSGDATYLVGKHGVDLAQLLPELIPDHMYQIPSIGHWSLHEMVAYVLRLIGPSRVWLTSWGITAEPLKVIMKLQEDGYIKELSALFDSRIRTQCPEAYQLTLNSNATVRMAKNHSKVVVLMNDASAATITTSSNLTRNPRIEHYVISTHRTIAEMNRSWIDMVMSGSQPFEAP